MKKLLLLIVLILLIAVYILGYWPQHQQVEQLQNDAAQLQQQLSTARDAAKICLLENEMLDLLDQTKAQNYGNAQKLAGQFFNDLQTEAARVPNASYNQDLRNILATRDAVVAGLARTDASTATSLQQSMTQLRQVAQQLASQAAR